MERLYLQFSGIGSVAERAATIRHGASAMAALYQATIPIYTVVLRRAFGVAGGAFADPDDGATSRVAWYATLAPQRITLAYFLISNAPQAVGRLGKSTP